MERNKSYYSEFYRWLSVLRNTRARYRLLFLLLAGTLIFINSAYAQTVTVTGRVTESTGNPLPGVSIIIKGTSSTGTTTGEEGQYTLPGVPADAMLSFSFVGFKTQEIPLNRRTRLNVQLQEDITALSEVVVNAGYYTVKDAVRTGSIARVTAKEIENQPVSNALSAVQGRVAGVNIIQGTGVAGGGYNIQIRGTNSLRREGNYPMYIIDGVPVGADIASGQAGAIFPNADMNPLNAINPNDIESIEILKDADATAIYGSRGANGVILITTRKGKAATKTTVSVNTNYTQSSVGSKMKMMNTQQYLEMRRQAFANDGITDYPANAYDINGTWDETRYTDWQDKLIGRTATNSNIQLSLSGGSENTNFLVSASHSGQTTVFAEDFKYDTDNLSWSLGHSSNDKKLIINASGLFSVQSNNVISQDITAQALRLSPNAPALYREDGSLNWENNTFANPVAAYESTYSNDSKTFNTSLNLSYEVLPSTYIKLNGGINYLVFKDIFLNPSSRYNPSFGITPATSYASKTQRQQLSYLLEPQLNYRHAFDEHHMDVLVGGTYQQTNNTVLGLTGSGFESNALINNMASASRISISHDNETKYKYAAVFGRINYQYKDRYILNLTGRRDGSSRFGPNNRFANFGALGAAWLFGEEDIFKSIRWLSFGKLRASYGLTGSDAIGDYQYLDTYTTSTTLYGDATTLYPSRLYNPYFSWEKTTKLEVALELGFMNDRIRLNTSLYHNRSGNQLVGIPLPGTTGFSSIQSNLPATVENKGLELELNTNPIRTNRFNWNSDFNISFPKNKLVSFPGIEGSTYANKYVVGYPTTILKLYNYEGIDPETGLYTFTDYNKDGNISSPEDNQVIENIGVRFFGGWSNEFSYKNLQFSFLFQFVNQRQLNYKAIMANPGTMFNQPIEVLNVWSEDNPDGEFMPYSTGSNPQKNSLLLYLKSSTATVSDASFVRLKNIQLSYLLPVNKYVRNIRLYVQGQNLLTITDYLGLDPEFVYTGYLPPLKTWSFGVQFNF
ncbi:SusC/RagA family TonB-linked outer membrane protein [Petrimonas sp.]|uniref:SusC/RagA family TonB-linked outer membrane protein n=1 Tax=Petrimonas sp. TaxID=2023866 RepID=UPI003F51952E